MLSTAGADPGSLLRPGRHLGPEEQLRRLLLYGLYHVHEQVERLRFVLEQGVLLTVGAESDPFPEPVELVEVVAPVPVDDLKQDEALEPSDYLGRQFLFPALVGECDRPVEVLQERVLCDAGDVGLREVQVDEKRVSHILFESVEVPGLLDVAGVGSCLDDPIRDVMEDICDLSAQVAARKHVQTLRVYHLALLIHDVVVIEEVLPDVEVVHLDALLRALDGLCDHRVSDDITLLYSKRRHDLRYPLGAEQAHEIVLKRDEELRGARVSLSAASPTELSVDAPGVVTLGPEDPETARHVREALFGVVLVAVRAAGALLGLALEAAPLAVQHALAQLDVRASPGHVRRDGHRACLPGAHHDLRLTLVMLGVQDVVRDTLALQQP